MSLEFLERRAQGSGNPHKGSAGDTTEFGKHGFATDGRLANGNARGRGQRQEDVDARAKADQAETLSGADRSTGLDTLVHDCKFNGREPFRADLGGGSRRKVDHSSLHKGSAIVDAHNHGFAGIEVGDFHKGAEWKALVCGR